MPPDPYVAWRNRNFLLYAASWFLMTFARQVETLTLRVYVYDQTKSPMALGWIGLLSALPIVLLAIPGGHIADRYNRRRVIMLMLAINGLISLVLMFSTLHHVPVLWIYGLIVVGAVGQALGGPSRSALLPQIVAAEIFSNAITWSSSIFQMGSMVGPASGGLILDWLGTPTAFMVVVACRLLSLGAMAGIRMQTTAPSGETLSLESLAAGIRFVRDTKLILATITLDLFAVLLGGATYLLPIFAKDILGVGKTGLGFLQSAEAVGAIITAILLTHLPPMKRAGRTMLWAVGGFGAATIVFGLSKWYWLSLGMMFLIGALDNISVVVRHTLVQMLTPDSMRGRVSAVNNVFIVTSNDLGGFESGLVARLTTPVISVVAGWISTILVVLSAARIWPQILSIGPLHEVRPADAAEVAEQVEDELSARS